jgi:hypothetical protein
MATREEIDNVDAGLELRKVKALEKIALNTEAIAMFLENLDTDDWSDRIQWYLSMFKEAYLDDKLEQKKK